MAMAPRRVSSLEHLIGSAEQRSDASRGRDAALQGRPAADTSRLAMAEYLQQHDDVRAEFTKRVNEALAKRADAVKRQTALSTLRTELWARTRVDQLSRHAPPQIDDLE